MASSSEDKAGPRDDLIIPRACLVLTNLNFAPGRLETCDNARKKPGLKSAVLFLEPSCRGALPVKRKRMLLLHAGWSLISLFFSPAIVCNLTRAITLTK